ncbi:MAG TPA: TonB-dependent receptor plug domain-containing protein, partial [Steroidobacteraceae bacterium]|nr:TonB-dependent receptor plug domain-containing protein [Steroidobacteraceae bacterium]
MLNTHRKHPVSVAVSMALLAAAATAAMASEQPGAPAENAPAGDFLAPAGGSLAGRSVANRSVTGAQSPARQDVPTTPASAPDAKKAKSDEAAKEAGETVTVVGVRQSQIKAIEVKRLADSIQDSISAESIGQLPDVTITDALQRITGVQINRDAGVGSSVDVRG